jgi:hypothetical protein
MKTICKLQIGTAFLDLTVACMETAVVLRIGDEDSRWRAERVLGSTAGANLWRFVRAASHRAVADYLDLWGDPEHEDAGNTIYVETGSDSVVRVELGTEESVNATAKLMAKVARRLAGREATILDANGNMITVRIPD